MNQGLTHSACLKGAAFRHCFISFPHHWRAFIAPASIPTFKIETASRCLIVSWSGHTHDHEGDEETIYVSLKLLKVNDIPERELVIVRQIQCPAPCTHVSMSTLSITDWEELLLNVEAAQEALLTQFRVVKSNQILPLWLEGGAFIYLEIHNLSNSLMFGLLQLNTEVEILPPSQSSSLPFSITPSSKNDEINEEYEIDSKTSIWNTLYSVFVVLGYGNKEIGLSPKQEVFLCLKSVPYSPLASTYQHNVFHKLLSKHPSIVFVSNENLRNTKYQSVNFFVTKIFKVCKGKNFEGNNSPATFQDSLNNSFFAIVINWDELKKTLEDEALLISEIDLILKHRTCILSHGLRRKLSLEMIFKIIIETSPDCSIQNKNFQIDVNVIKPCTKDDNFISTSLASVFSDLSNTCPLLLNDYNVVNFDINKENVDIALSTRDGNPILIDKTSIPLLSINVESKANKPVHDLLDEEETDSVTESNFSRTLVHEKTFEDLVKQISQDLNLTASSPLCPQFTLLQGSKGSGKTTVMENVVRKISASPYFIHCEVIHLKLLKGKRVDSVKKELLTSIRKALDYQPSLIVLDDLDFLAPSEIQEEKGPLFEHQYSMSFMFKSLLCQLLEDIKRNSSVSFAGMDLISIVATCCSRNGVHPMLSSPKGNHIFPKSVHIHPLNGEGKLIVIESLLQSFQQQFLHNNKISRCKDDLTNYIFQYSRNEIMVKLDGFALPDMNSLALRIFVEAKARWKQDYKIEIDNHFIETDEHSKELFNFLNEDVTNALEGFVALSCKSLGISTPLQKKLKIGGLKKAQAALEEMILWPSQYPDLFRQTQLRLRSGVLLYGPPGCGKTLLANSFKNASHLNFITVKGPELLSKYIGQSEKSVRDTFERAEMAKPCVLFFDEFDSIATRRGQNNTGVTDRVVNQLLTQMDGVEGLSEVYVVAATSRPDLIDPALLRPGRLDKGIYCPMPTESEREEILSLLSEDLLFHTQIDFGEIAKKTEGFSGADLQSVLSNAQMRAAREAIGKSLYEGVQDSVEDTAEEDREEFIRVSIDGNNGVRVDEKRGWGGKDGRRNEESAVGISEENLRESLEEARPSVSVGERLKHEKLHQMFSNDKESKVFAQVKPGKRETLA